MKGILKMKYMPVVWHKEGQELEKNVPVVIIRLLFMVDNNFQIVHPENNTSYKTIGFW